MINKQIISEITSEIIEKDNLFLVDVKCSDDAIIEVLIDSKEGINIDKCAEISRQIEAHLNRDEQDFQLTVGSAGIGDPLKVLPQYYKHKGKEVEVLLKSGIKLSGTMSEVADNGITITFEKKVEVEGKKRKVLQEFNEALAFDDIKSTKLIIKF